MRSIAAWACVPVAFWGCATTIPVRPDAPLDNDRVFNESQVDARLEGTTCTVRCTNSVDYTAYDCHVRMDTVKFKDLDLNRQHTVAIRDILTISYQDHVRGAFTGGLLGSVAGAVAGIGILIIHGVSSSDGVGAGVLLLGMVGAGAVAGGVIGALEGSTQEFRFEASEDSVRSSAGSNGHSGVVYISGSFRTE